MQAKSSRDTYGTVAVTLHWLSALLIVVLLGSGFRAAGLTDPEAKAQILGLHAPLGIAVLLLTLVRVGWWWFADRKPDPVAGMPRWQHVAARTVHVLLYVVVLGMTASGIGMFVLSGAGAIVFGGTAGSLPDFWDYRPRLPHGVGSRVMVALLVVHAGAALYHHVVMRDASLRRIWFGNTAR